MLLPSREPAGLVPKQKSKMAQEGEDACRYRHSLQELLAGPQGLASGLSHSVSVELANCHLPHPPHPSHLPHRSPLTPIVLRNRTPPDDHSLPPPPSLPLLCSAVAGPCSEGRRTALGLSGSSRLRSPCCHDNSSHHSL